MADSNRDRGSLRRADRWERLLHAFLHGLRPIQTTRDTQNFFQSVCSIENHALCVEKIGCSSDGLDVLGDCLRHDISLSSINGVVSELLAYFAVPEVKRVAGGEILKRVLTRVVAPPLLWDAMVHAHHQKQLTPQAQLNFAWLLLELVTWGEDCPVAVHDIAIDVTQKKSFLQSENRELRGFGYRIERIVQTQVGGLSSHRDEAGGRHDNDFADYRRIAIYPTEDELNSSDRPFYNAAGKLLQVPSEERVGFHLDNQFRLLREDFLAELREDVRESSGKGNASRRRPRTRLQQLRLSGVYCGEQKSRQPFSLALSAGKGLERIVNASDPHVFLRDHPDFLRHRSFGYFFDDGKIVAFGTLLRIERLLCESLPKIVVQTPTIGALEKLLLALATSKNVDFIIIDTAVFAYEPVLRCLQAKVELPLAELLLASDDTSPDLASLLDNPSLMDLADKIESSTAGQDLQKLLNLSKQISIDKSQEESLLAGLRQPLSLIQGPPGTGKSLLGALLAKALHDHTSENILVICYTNHNLDQFLEDLMAIGIPSDNMVRLGAKSSQKTEHLTIRQQAGRRSRPPEKWDAINRLNDEANERESELQASVQSFMLARASHSKLLEHLEFSDDDSDSDFFEAFQVPEEEAGFQKVGKDNKIVDGLYLLHRWTQGKDPGIFASHVSPWHKEIWDMGNASRTDKLKQWESEMLKEEIGMITSRATLFDATQNTLRETLDQSTSDVIQKKRIVACTTTGAAMHYSQLQSAAPGIILVEEAGEILESHILTAMTPSTKQLILIGDHRQLRPKIKNYNLSVEKGDGFDLNRSLFERLANCGFPHTTLEQQHRMCPEISRLIRHLTYPTLTDAASTKIREPLRGLLHRVVFIKHEKPELASHISDRRDQGALTSKQNAYEVELVKKIVKYLAQQGYGASKQVVLTPYLGQLGLLRRELASDHDPVLNDLDSYDLVKAGLLSPASASQSKRPLRLSTIDNYQGEESDVVIISLTRSNADGDIGFMMSPERLNVLLSRARKGLIVVGNPATFMASRKGGELWTKFFDLLAKANSIFDGLPVRCEQHKDRQMMLETPSDFDECCPDGGCSADCGVLLPCGLHKCQRKCHRVEDHTKVKCTHLVRNTCPQGHALSRKCFEGHPTSCHICDAEAAAKLARQARDMELEQKRQAKQMAYAQKLAAIEDEMARIRDHTRLKDEQEDQLRHLAQRQRDLEQVRARIAQQEAMKLAAQQQPKPKLSAPEFHATNNPDTSREVTNSSQKTPESRGSQAQQDWEHQKVIEGAQNPALDELMSMIGLESVKGQFLEIKNKIDVLIRQNLLKNIQKERFGAALLGNPGTGKTTVARLYAKFLCAVGALPGDEFVETSGAKLANDGVQGCKKLLDDLLNKDGGVFFIDEAYQLTSGSSFGGGAVLDFLLPEVENLNGKVVFVLAGYNKPMEKFFQHNEGLSTRFPRRLHFDDYEDSELLAIMEYNLKKNYEGQMELEDGSRGLYARIVSRRIGRGRGKEGFGNAREVQNVIAKIADRQANRLRKERRNAKNRNEIPDDMLLTKEDLIGAEPSTALTSCKAWTTLQNLTGLKSVKSSIKALVDSLVYNYHRELAEEPLLDFSLNKVFIGNPGTGKTTVAKLYGRILADIGMLSSSEVVIKKPADFIGAALGVSEANTKAILDNTVGKVLLIDEAYGLFAGDTNKDPYRAAVIDTIVAEVQGVPGDDRCVLLLGYKEQMQEMMQKSNPGLARRFPIDSGFVFEDFSHTDMATIFDSKLGMAGYKATERARGVALEKLQRARNRPKFGNAGEVDILLNDAKLKQQIRLAKETNAPQSILEAQDFDEDFDRADRAVTNVEMLFQDTIGCDNIIAKLQEYQTIVANLKKLDSDPREVIPFAFLFRGPPGTGKTTTAEKMGKVFYDMGFLSSAEVISCSASDLVGQYVGQTGPKTRDLLESALGKVLFIDEAYRLGGGQFAKEATDELVDCMTNDRFKQKLIIILAGYDKDINALMSSNQGLSSRFSEALVFEPLKPQDCLDLLKKLLSKKKFLDTTTLTNITPESQAKVLHSFTILAETANFANARDIQTLSKKISSHFLKQTGTATDGMVVSVDLVLESVRGMINERRRRENDAACQGREPPGMARPLQQELQQPPLPPTMHTRNTTATEIRQELQHEAEELVSSPEKVPEAQSSGADSKPTVPRDAGVSDAIWDQLQADRKKAEDAEREYQADLKKEQEIKAWLKACADAKRQKELDEIERKRKEAEEKRRQEKKKQQLLQQMGRCPVGFAWIKQSGGYRCAGGSHWVNDGQLENMMRGSGI